ncbi:hypothetical protein PGTUg99_036605 [Puccinia graminis f. sp. tritici]|uniref:Uncharacterized protein n=1 Tax=Puccinia graminis f. sp. tritici TaxID=56615 RepID=A0A5B0S3G6_PUCGR|nr:hypothetical protein PGTUg99_036605 [Puccinia graminis f. sp. tritici]
MPGFRRVSVLAIGGVDRARRVSGNLRNMLRADTGVPDLCGYSRPGTQPINEGHNENLKVFRIPLELSSGD